MTEKIFSAQKTTLEDPFKVLIILIFANFLESTRIPKGSGSQTVVGVLLRGTQNFLDGTWLANKKKYNRLILGLAKLSELSLSDSQAVSVGHVDEHASLRLSHQSGCEGRPVFRVITLH